MRKIHNITLWRGEVFLATNGSSCEVVCFFLSLLRINLFLIAPSSEASFPELYSKGRPSSCLPRFAPGWEHCFSFRPPQRHRDQWFPACPTRVGLEPLLQLLKEHVSGVTWSRPAQPPLSSAAPQQIGDDFDDDDNHWSPWWSWLLWWLGRRVLWKLVDGRRCHTPCRPHIDTSLLLRIINGHRAHNHNKTSHFP